MLAEQLYNITNVKHPEVEAIESARHYINQLDLNYVIQAMCDESYPLPRWTNEMAERCSKLYKNFLLLQRLYPEVPLVPTREIDEFWHNHILYTREYHHDCLSIFGHYLHHSPTKPDEDPLALIDAFKRTKDLYFDTFNEQLSILMD